MNFMMNEINKKSGFTGAEARLGKLILLVYKHQKL